MMKDFLKNTLASLIFAIALISQVPIVGISSPKEKPMEIKGKSKKQSKGINFLNPRVSFAWKVCLALL